MMTTSSQPDWGSKTYLLIDDFSIVHRMLRDMLHKLGAVAIDTVKNGADAISLLRQKQYDVVLCDYNFSEGPNGQQILEEAKHRELVGLSSIWIMVSSEKAMEIVMGAAELAPDGYILKPLTESLLLARLNRAWDKKQAFTAIDRAYAARNFEKALQLCDQRLAADRIHAMDLLRMKASLLLKCGELQQARLVFERALALREQVWAKAGLARIYFLNSQYGDAKKLLQEIVLAHPAFLDAYDLLAQTLQHLGESSQALHVLEKAVRLSPFSVMRQKNLGEVALKLDELDIAEQAFKMSIEVGEYSVLKTPDAYLGLAQLYGIKQQPEQALEMLELVRQTFEGDQIDLRTKLIESQVYADNGMPDKARQTTEETHQHLMATNASLGTDASLEAAQLLSATGDANMSSEIIRKILTSDPMESEAGIVQPLQSNASVAARPTPAEPDVSTAEESRGTPDAQPVAGNVLALYQRALALIEYMKRNGYNAVSAQETRSILARAEKLAPGNSRAGQLMAMLQGLASGRR